jgi:hypothetical protein
LQAGPEFAMVHATAERAMKPIEKDELFTHLNGFLKARGIELTEGSYSNGIQKTCSLLADAINLGQQGFDRAKTQFDKRLDQMRQVIHEKTAPKPSTASQVAQPPPTAPPTQAAASSQASSSSTGSAAKKSRSKKAKRSKSRRRR